MKAGAFGYARAESVAHALDLLARYGEGAKLLAGGQSLLPALNLRLSVPDVLIDIGRLDALRGIAVADGRLRIGALTTHDELLSSPVIAAHAPLLARAVAHVAHPAIRTRGTIGGSLANADPAAELPACILALDARIVAVSARGERALPADGFFTGLFATALAPDEILAAVDIALPVPGACWGFGELARRAGDYAMVGIAAAGRREGARLAALRLAFFGVGTRVTLAPLAAAALCAGAAPADAVAAAKEALGRDLTPHDDLNASAETRLALARVLLGRVVASLSP